MDGLLYASYANSDRQREYIRQRLEDRRREKEILKRSLSSDDGSIEHVENYTTTTQHSFVSHDSVDFSPRSGTTTNILPGDDNYYAGAEAVMDPSSIAALTRVATGGNAVNNTLGSISGSSTTTSSSSHSDHAHQSLLANPYELRHGRRFLRDMVYPLPCDLVELQRQNMRTLMGTHVFGRAVCAPQVSKTIPQRVLEVGCGSGYWSVTCHEYFTSLGHGNVSFTGLDIAPLTPDLKKQGLDWTFVQHDMRRCPWPFDDEDFDFIMVKDMSLAIPLGGPSQKFLDECIRLLKVGGVMEIWESDHVLRTLLPHPPPPTAKQRADNEQAIQTGTFLISPGTPFAPAQNKYLRHANGWIQEALDRKKLPPTPCARIANILYQEPECLGDIGWRRIAIPLGELRWERDSVKHIRSKSDAADELMTGKGKARASERASERSLTADQAALRQTALLTVLQKVESLEPLLKEVSGKNSEEWSHWWASMMADLMDSSKGSTSGEVLEVGAWWATKIAEE